MFKSVLAVPDDDRMGVGPPDVMSVLRAWQRQHGPMRPHERFAFLRSPEVVALAQAPDEVMERAIRDTCDIASARERLVELQRDDALGTDPALVPGVVVESPQPLTAGERMPQLLLK